MARQSWTPIAAGFDVPNRDRLLAPASRVEEWPGLELRTDVDQLVDYLPNNIGARLCSLLMKRAVDGSIGPLDEVQWLPASVVDRSGNANEYFVLHPRAAGLLNAAESVVGGDFVVKPVFSKAKLRGRNVLRVPDSTLTLVVTERVRRALVNAECSGVDFEEPAVRAS